MKHRLLHEIIPVTTSHGCGTKRVLLAKEDTQTNLTQIAVTGLKQGERSEMHVHPTMEEVFLIRKGTVKICMETEETVCHADECISIAAGERHALEALTDAEILTIGCATE